MTDKITFKQYLDSKERLTAAIEESPIHTATYHVHKYTNLPVGESKESKIKIPLKPTQKLHIKWKYDDINNPQVINIMFEGIDEVDPTKEHIAFWASDRLSKWLIKNTTEQF